MPKVYIIFFVGLVLVGCKPTKETIRFSGSTMGTTYNIVITQENADIAVRAKHLTEDILERVNANLSNWDPESEVSKFNTFEAGQAFTASSMLLDVMDTANRVHEKSNGFFDTTLGPVINLWGFGPSNSNKKIPSHDQITDALSKVGQTRQIKFDKNAKTLTKLNPEVSVNLSAIAKGYGIDQIAEGLSKLGIENFMVEIGGDLITRGKNPKGQSWQIGIEQPDQLGNTIQQLVKISDLAMATSGDYRNYFEDNGIRYSHIISPKTGYPIKHKTVSVTVLAENAILADTWATALLALGEKDGLKIAEDNKIAAFFISHSDNGAYMTSISSNFKTVQNK